MSPICAPAGQNRPAHPTPSAGPSVEVPCPAPLDDGLPSWAEDLGAQLANQKLSPAEAAQRLLALPVNPATRRELLIQSVQRCSQNDSHLSHGFLPAWRMAQATLQQPGSVPNAAETRLRVEAKLQQAFEAQGASKMARREAQQKVLPTLSGDEAAHYRRWLKDAAAADRRNNLRSILSLDDVLHWGAPLGLALGLGGVAVLSVAQQLGWPIGLAFEALAIQAPVLAGVGLLVLATCAGMVMTVGVPYLLYALTPLGQTL